MADDYTSVLLQSKDRLFFYSYYRFLRDCDRETIFDQTVLSPWLGKIRQGAVIVREVLVDSEPHYVLMEPLSWDTRYFGLPVYKVYTVLYAHNDFKLLKRALQKWTSEIAAPPRSYYYFDIPSEDTCLIQAICECGFRMIETRLHYVFSGIDAHSSERYPVRNATEDDIDNLKKIAIKMRNPYDRLHADIAFTQETADAYLGTYVENGVRGFVDLILVPAEGSGPPDAFITSSFPETILGKRIAKFGPTAVSNVTRKGWSRKLISETVYVLKDKGTDCILLDTQPANGPSIGNLTTFGFRLAFGTHIFSNPYPGAR